ncbi:MAG TPA: hypothetical protein P5524_00500 [Candidatus Paceibacterota bacterium]|nr:hypothetical protein [Candidatus Paceibacterota bacterium]
MEKKTKASLSEYLVVAVLILLFCFGGFIFAIAVGFDGIAKILLLIATVIGVFALLAKFLPNVVIPFLYILLTTAALYAFGGSNLIYYVIGTPIIILAYWGLCKIGDHFGWWKSASWNK